MEGHVPPRRLFRHLQATHVLVGALILLLLGVYIDYRARPAASLILISANWVTDSAGAFTLGTNSTGLVVGGVDLSQLLSPAKGGAKAEDPGSGVEFSLEGHTGGDLEAEVTDSAAVLGGVEPDVNGVEEFLSEEGGIGDSLLVNSGAGGAVLGSDGAWGGNEPEGQQNQPGNNKPRTENSSNGNTTSKALPEAPPQSQDPPPPITQNTTGAAPAPSGFLAASNADTPSAEAPLPLPAETTPPSQLDSFPASATEESSSADTAASPPPRETSQPPLPDSSKADSQVASPEGSQVASSGGTAEPSPSTAGEQKKRGKKKGKKKRRKDSRPAVPIVVVETKPTKVVLLFLKLTRISNPDSPLYLITTRGGYHDGGVKTQLEKWGVVVDFLEDFSQGDSSIDTFRASYKHHSVNPASYEMLCFERFLVVRDVAVKHGLQQLAFMDSDIALFQDLRDTYLYGHEEGLVSITSYSTYFGIWRLPTLNQFADYILWFYSRPEEAIMPDILTYGIKWTEYGWEGRDPNHEHEVAQFSDMFLLHMFSHATNVSTKFFNTYEGVEWDALRAIENPRHMRPPGDDSQVCASPETFDSYIGWRKGPNRRLVPYDRNDEARKILSGIHFQGVDCKANIFPHIFQKLFPDSNARDMKWYEEEDGNRRRKLSERLLNIKGSLKLIDERRRQTLQSWKDQ